MGRLLVKTIHFVQGVGYEHSLKIISALHTMTNPGGYGIDIFNTAEYSMPFTSEEIMVFSLGLANMSAKLLAFADRYTRW